MINSKVNTEAAHGTEMLYPLMNRSHMETRVESPDVLFHFTAMEMLHGIGKHGLTVGDVPTDIFKNRGLIGVWLTSSPSPEGHGLNGTLNKKAVRLTIRLPEGANALRWKDWAPGNVQPATFDALTKADGSAHDSWWIFFGWIKPEWIIQAVRTSDGSVIENWQTVWPVDASQPGVPYWRKEAWQKKMLARVKRKLAQNF